MMVIFGILEMARLVMVLNALGNGARAGVRYAIVHGGDRTGTLGTSSGPSSSANYTQVQTAAKNIAGAAPLNVSNITVTVNYPSAGSCNTPGCLVQVKVAYPYDPFMTYFTFSSLTLHSSAEGAIVF